MNGKKPTMKDIMETAMQIPRHAPMPPIKKPPPYLQELAKRTQPQPNDQLFEDPADEDAAPKS